MKWFALRSPWTLIALCGCASLTAVDFWRDAGLTAFPLLRGTLPNLVAVPTLAFGLLMVRYPKRKPSTPARAAEQTVWFWRAWLGAFVLTVAWEYAQRLGALVFDPLDLYATVAGAGLAIALFFACRPISFLQPT